MTAISDFPVFLNAARALCGDTHVQAPSEAETSQCTSGTKRTIAATIYPNSTEEIQSLLTLSRTHKISVHPVSTGRNWGYGGSNAVADNSVIINLSRLNKIISYDGDVGTVTIEPGVTQAQLSEFLKAQGNKFSCFVTGSSPDCSMIGNALERGYGANPLIDHFSAVLSLSAIMPDGSVYQPLMAELGAGRADRLYKWGVGPYLDGLFSQSGLGIVTSMTLLLAPQPEETAIVFFDPAPETTLAQLVDMCRDIRFSTSDALISIKILNQMYILALAGVHLDDGVPVTPGAYAQLGKKYHVTDHKVIGMLSGSPRQIAATIKDIRATTRNYKGRLVVLKESFVTRSLGLLSLPVIRNFVPHSLSEKLAILQRSYGLIRGQPSEKMLELAYWKNAGHRSGAALHPARDGCGLLWVPLIVPNKGDEAAALYSEVSAKIWAAGLEPLMGLTHINSACSIMLYGLIYDRAVYESKIRPLHEELIQLAKARGLMSYRLHIDDIAGLPQQGTAREMMRAVKERFDPDNLMSPGRFN